MVASYVCNNYSVTRRTYDVDWCMRSKHEAMIEKRNKHLATSAACQYFNISICISIINLFLITLYMHASSTLPSTSYLLLVALLLFISFIISCPGHVKALTSALALDVSALAMLESIRHFSSSSQSAMVRLRGASKPLK